MQRQIGLHRANHRQVVDTGGNVRKKLAYRNARLTVTLERPRTFQPLAVTRRRRVGRCCKGLAIELGQFWLWIERIDVRYPAVHETENNIASARRKMPGTWRG